MTVLAIDTSSRDHLVAVLAERGGRLLERREGAGATVAAVLPAAIAELRGDHLDALVVVLGPGSYTGLRAGIAAAVGVAAAAGLPLHGVGSLEVVAAGSEPCVPAPIVIRDAGRGFVYLGDPPARRPRPAHAAGVEPPLTVDESLSDIARVLDHAVCLAGAVPLALSRPALQLAGIEAVYVV